MLKRISITILVAMVLTVETVHAGHFADDWIAQKISTGPNYFETDRRGFGTLGSASMRFRVGNDHPISVTPPSFKSGCGGIDVFLGGYSFLKFDQLVKKFEKTMGPAAAAFAFDIALSVLSNQASESVKSLASMVDRLNQLQFDDCKAGQALAVTVEKAVAPGVVQANKTNAVKEFVSSTGITELYNSINDVGRSLTADQTQSSLGGGQTSEMIAGCPVEIKQIFFTEGYVLDHLGDKRGLPSSYIEMMRGLTGDYYIQGATLNGNSVDRCKENSGQLIDAIIKGGVYIHTSSSTDCEPMSSVVVEGQSYDNILDWIHTSLAEIAKKVANKGPALTESEGKLLSSIPTQIFTAIETEISKKNSSPELVADTFDDFVATMQAYNMLSDFYAALDNVLRLSATVYNNTQGASGGNSQERCQLKLVKPPFDSMNTKRKELADMLEDLHDEYSIKMSEMESHLAVTRRIDEQKQAFDKRLGSIVGQGVLQWSGR